MYIAWCTIDIHTHTHTHTHTCDKTALACLYRDTTKWCNIKICPYGSNGIRSSGISAFQPYNARICAPLVCAHQEANSVRSGGASHEPAGKGGVL